MKLGRQVVFFDFETTGLDPQHAEPIEVAAVTVNEDGHEINRYSSLIRIQEALPFSIERLTGITEDMLRHAPKPEYVAKELEAFIGDSFLAAHNIPFDQSFLVKLGIEIDRKRQMDSCVLACLICPELPRHSMDYLKQVFDIETENSHRALDDVLATIQLVEKLEQHAKSKKSALKAMLPALRTIDYSWLPLLEAAFSESYDESQEDNNVTNHTQLTSKTFKKGQSAGEFFAEDGPLSELYDRYEVRPSQVEMATEIETAFRRSKNAFIEAPTGTGKSAAYSVAAISAIQSNSVKKPVAIATRTKALQDQLDQKDLPLLVRGFEQKVQWQVLKGKQNYICSQRLNDEISALKVDLDEGYAISLAYLASLTESSRIGDLDHASYYMKQRYEALDAAVRSVRGHFCSGTDHHAQCPIGIVSKRAHEADMIVLNHSLLLTRREDIPKFERVIFDEAHELENSLRDSLSVEISSKSLAYYFYLFGQGVGGIGYIFKRLSAAEKDRFKTYMEELNQNYIRASRRLKDFKALILEVLDPHFNKGKEDYPSVKRRYDRLIGRQKLDRLFNVFLTDLNAIDTSAKHFHRSIKNPSSSMRRLEDKLKDIRKETEKIIKDIKIFLLPHHANQLQLLEGERIVAEPWMFKREPIGVSWYSRKILLDHYPSVILTTATARVGKEKFVERRLGYNSLSENKDRTFKCLKSPWPEPKVVNVLLSDIVTPTIENMKMHTDYMAHILNVAAQILGGRTMGLFTALRRMKLVGEKLRERLSAQNILLLEQHRDGGVQKLVEKMREDQRTAIIGSSSLWVGVDIPGPALSCVVIENIPFGSPYDPSHAARRNQCGLNIAGFFNYDLPKALLELRQGTGRLLRSAGDRGIIIIARNSVKYKSYYPDPLSFVFPSRKIHESDLNQFAREFDAWALELGIKKGEFYD